MSSKIKRCACFAVFMLLFCVPAAYARMQGQATEPQFQTAATRPDNQAQPAQDYRQKIEEVITEEKPDEQNIFGTDAYFRYMPSCGVDAMSGKVGVMEAAEEYTYNVKAFGQLPIEFSVETNYLSITNSTPVELPAKLTGVAFGIETTVPFFFDKTYLRFGAFPAFYTDSWSWDSSSFRIPSRYFVIHQPNDKWTFILGVAVYPDYRDKVLPIAGFIYKPNDRLTFNIIPTRPSISYLLNDRLTVFWEGGSSSNEYEVTKDNIKHTVLEYKELHTGGGVKFKLNKYIETSLAVGGIFNRQLKYRDSLGKVNIDGGFYSECRLELRI